MTDAIVDAFLDDLLESAIVPNADLISRTAVIDCTPTVVVHHPDDRGVAMLRQLGWNGADTAFRLAAAHLTRLASRDPIVKRWSERPGLRLFVVSGRGKLLAWIDDLDGGPFMIEPGSIDDGVIVHRRRVETRR